MFQTEERLGILIYVASVLVGAVLFAVIEGWSLSDSIYFSALTVKVSRAIVDNYINSSTHFQCIGPSIVPATRLGKSLTIIFALVTPGIASIQVAELGDRLTSMTQTLVNNAPTLPIAASSAGPSKFDSIFWSVLRSRLGPSLLAFTLASIVSTVAFMYLEGLSLLDAAFVSTYIATTVGYGSIGPETPSGRMFAAIYAIFLCATGSQLLSQIGREIIAQVAARRLRRPSSIE